MPEDDGPRLALSDNAARQLANATKTVAQMSTMLGSIPRQCRIFLGQPYFAPGTTPNKFFMPSVTPDQ